MKVLSKFFAVAAVALVLFQLPALAADEGWKDTAEFSLVNTSGNSEGTAFGFKNTLSKAWDKSSFEVKAGAVRVETTALNVPMYDAGTMTYFTEDVTTTTTESYYLNGRYDRKISEKFFWYGGAGWERNEPAGLENRYTAIAGVGNVWFDNDDRKFRTDYAVTYTDQSDVVVDPNINDTFAGLRLGWNYMTKVGENSTYTNDLIVDANLDESDDYRADMVNALSVAMSERLALKLSLQWQYDHLPALGVIKYSSLTPPGVDETFELDDLDQIFTAALVISF